MKIKEDEFFEKNNFVLECKKLKQIGEIYEKAYRKMIQFKEIELSFFGEKESEIYVFEATTKIKNKKILQLEKQLRCFCLVNYTGFFTPQNLNIENYLKKYPGIFKKIAEIVMKNN